MYDLATEYEDGRRGAVEVTAAEDQRLAADHGALQKAPIMHDDRLTRGWLAHLTPRASVQVARVRLPELLLQLEQAGLDELDRGHVGSWEQYEEQEHLRALLEAAGAAPCATTGPEQWRAVLERLDAALGRLRREAPTCPWSWPET